MKRPIALLVLLLGACAPAGPLGSAPASADTPAAITYPATRTVAAADTFQGAPVADPYRWLERTDDPAVQAWIDAQDALTVGYLRSTPDHERIRRRLTELQPRVRYGLPSSAGGRYFYRRSDAGRLHTPLYPRSTATTCAAGARRSSGGRRSTSIPLPTLRSSASSPAATARACRCSSRTAATCPAMGVTRPT